MSRFHGDPTEGVQRVYARQAAHYDRRWKAYLASTLQPLLHAHPPPPSGRLLDVGCGTGLLLEMVLQERPALEVWGVDLSPEMLARARERLPGRARLLEADGAALPLADESVAVAYSASSLHHWWEPAAVLAEIRRVLRPGGTLALVDWCADHRITRLRAHALAWIDPSHHRAYSVGEARALLENAGFEVLSLSRHSLGWRWGFMTFVARRSDGPAEAAP